MREADHLPQSSAEVRHESFCLHLPSVVTYEADYRPFPVFFCIAFEMCVLKDEFFNEKGR